MTDQEARPETATPPLYEWVFHPARASWAITTLVTLFLFLLSVMVYWLTGSRLFTIVAVFVLIGSMRSFYFATTYQLYEDKIKVNYTLSSLSKEWKIYRTFYPERNGVFLSTLIKPSRLENFRGLFLKYGGADREKILAVVKEKVRSTEDAR